VTIGDGIAFKIQVSLDHSCNPSPHRSVIPGFSNSRKPFCDAQRELRVIDMKGKSFEDADNVEFHNAPTALFQI
jgi:hypothetical protein